jgi:CubicO group peptidase (beta-lactamase class C family)
MSESYRATRAIAQALLDDWLAEQQQRLGVVGVAAGVVFPDGTELTMAHGYANRRLKVPMTVDTPMRVASITKLFTVTALLMARDRGLLSLDAPASLMIPELSTIRSPAPAPAPITLRQIVSHTSGLPKDLPYGVQYWDRGDSNVQFPSANEAREFLKDLSLVCTPMTTVHYSNIGFLLAGLAVEAAFKQPYEDLIRSRVLDPLGMRRSFFWSRSGIDDLAQGYRPSESTLEEAPNMDVGWDTAGGGLCCSANDLVRFVKLHLSDRPVGEAQILSGSSVREARQPVYIAPAWDQGVGLGWWLRRFDGQIVAVHSGNIAGFDSCLVLAPDLGIGAFVLCNTNASGCVDLLAKGVLAPLLAAMQEQKEMTRLHERPGRLAGVERVTGQYSTFELIYDVIAVGDRLAIVSMGDLTKVAWLEPTPDDGHFIGGSGFACGEPVIFQERCDGVFMELVLQGMRFRRV